MDINFDKSDDILEEALSGLHVYSLGEQVHLSFASKNLCEILHADKSDFLNQTDDAYLSFIHPEDRLTYIKELEKIKNEEGPHQLNYRLLTKDGNILYVCDNFHVRKNREGALEGYSVLCDITNLQKERNTLKILNDNLPCGFLKYTCERHPKVTYANNQMKNIMRLPETGDGEIDCFDLYCENIYLMVPLEERSRLAYCLSNISIEDAPVAGELTVTRCDGKKARLFGWVAKHLNDLGEEEFISVCMDITERYRRNKEKETANYIRALTDVYDKIFEYDYTGNTVKCLYWQNADNFKWMMDVPMQIDDATEKWIEASVYSDDRKKVSEYFKEFYDNRLLKSNEKPNDLFYREVSSEGEVRTHRGLFLKIDSSTCLFCSRCLQEKSENDILRNENRSLKDMQEMVMKFSEGLSAFQIKDQMVTPLYVSDNLLEFFGFTREEWLPMMKKAVPIRKLVSRCEVDYGEFVKLLSQGEAEFTYYDLKEKKERHIKAITSQKNPAASSPYYVMLYNLDEKGSEKKPEEYTAKRVNIRCFGYFDVFVDGKPIPFRNEKSKELLALLVDRKGGFVTSEEAINFLWEDTPVDSLTLARYRKVALKLKNILEEYGISYILDSVNGKRRIVTDYVNCDLYSFLTGKEEFQSLFKGSYLTNYSWGETTLAELLQAKA